MALRDFNVSTFSPEHIEANEAEARIAHERNGTLEQRDWSRISRNAVADGFRSVHGATPVQFLIDTDLDTRHVAILCAPDAHLDPYEIQQIVQAAPVDGSAILAAYLYALTDVLEGYYSKACHLMNYHPFIENGEAQWSLVMGRDYESYISLLAELWRASKQQFLFDAGRKQLLYAALEADLAAHGNTPEWFIPSQSFLPYAGRDADTNLIMWDLQVFEIPATGYDWRLSAPEGPKPGLTRMIGKLKNVWQ